MSWLTIHGQYIFLKDLGSSVQASAQIIQEYALGLKVTDVSMVMGTKKNLDSSYALNMRIYWMVEVVNIGVGA